MNYDLFREVDRNLIINDQVQTLESEVGELRRETLKAKSFIQDFFDRRSKPRDANQEVDYDINVRYSKRSLLNDLFVKCTSCNSELPQAAIQEHLKVCHFKTFLMGQMLDDIESQSQTDESFFSATVRPQPPRNLRISSSSSSSFTIQWDSPIFDGGAAIVDYELVFSCRQRRVRVNCKCLCMRNPLPTSSFVIDGLTASNTYSNIKLRCKNDVGWSDFSSRIDSIQTQGPNVPSPPQRFSILQVGSNFIDLSWTPPFYKQGSEIVEYLLQYFEPIPYEQQSLGSGPKQERFEKRIIVIKPNVTSFRIEGLRGGTCYGKLELIARNAHGLSSLPARCEDASTTASTRAEDLRQEIKWARSSTLDYIDSDFLTGVVQREERRYYIQKLQSELSSIPGEDMNIESNILSEESKTADDTTEHVKSQREYQFEYRMKSIQDIISSSLDEIETIENRRFFLSMQMGTWEERSNAIKAELKRISELEGQHFVNSNVLHKSDQRFELSELNFALSKEMISISTQVESWKREIVDGDSKIKYLEKTIEQNKERLSERRAAYYHYRTRLKRSLLSGENVRIDQTLLEPCFKAWFSLSKTVMAKNQRISFTSNQIRTFLLRLSVTKWTKIVEISFQIEHRKRSNLSVLGKGGRSLIKVEIERMESKECIQDTLARMKINGNDPLPDEIYCPKTWSQQGLFGIILGDHYFHEKKYTKAVTLYETLPAIVGDLNINDYQKMEYLNVIEYKIGKGSYLQGLYSKAMLYFESVLSRSTAIGNATRTVALAHLGLGDSYLALKDVTLAHDHYSHALVISKDNVNFLSISMLADQGIQNSTSFPLGNKLNSNEIFDNNDLRRKIMDGMASADRLKTRLYRFGGLKKGYLIPIEHVSVRLVKIRMRKEYIRNTIHKKEEELKVLNEDISHLPNLMNRIKDEINGEKNGSDRASTLVHDNLQLFDDFELQEKLKFRLQESEINLEEAEDRKKQICNLIKNMNDEDSDLDEEAILETCPLMNRILSQRRIRLMAFNSLNEYEGKGFIAVTIDREIYLHDLIYGKAKCVFDGNVVGNTAEKTNCHTKTITSLLYHGDKILSGSMDNTVKCWSSRRQCLLYTAIGHTATITSLAIQDELLLTGSLDMIIIVRTLIDGKELRLLRGHSRGILSLTSWPSFFASADSDGDIAIWSYEFECVKRLQLIPRNRVTVLRCGQQEIISGDSAGFVSVFWIESGKIIRQCKAHESLVTDLSFDATKIVSCSTDGTVKVLDMLTCQILHTIRCDDAPICKVIFDKTKIVALSTTGFIQHLLWDSRDQLEKEGYTYHVYVEGDSASSICKQYQLNYSQLMKMNTGIEITKIPIGTRLVVGWPNHNHAVSHNETSIVSTDQKFRNSSKQHFELQEENDENVLAPQILSEKASLASRFLTETDEQ